MTAQDEQIIKSALQTLAHIAYENRKDIKKLEGADPKVIDELNSFKKALEDMIEKLFVG